MEIPSHPPEGAAPARARTFLPRLSLVFVALAFAAFSASALAGSFAAKLNYQITDSIPANSLGNVFSNPRASTARSTCGAVQGNQNLTAGPFHYKVYTFKNLRGWWSGGVEQEAVACVNVSLLVNSGSASAALYYRNFNPSNPNTYFAASVGGLGAGQMGDFSVDFSTLSSSRLFDVIVYETIPNGGASYTLLVEGTGIVQSAGGPPTATGGVQSFQARPAAKGVRVSWRSGGETDAVGYNLYRGTTRKLRLTRGLVRASRVGTGHTYNYVDRSAANTRGPYYLEVVHRSGSKIMFGPARKAR